MNALMKPIVAITICIAAAVCFGAAAEIHAMSRPNLPAADSSVDLTLADAIIGGRNGATAVDFWMP